MEITYRALYLILVLKEDEAEASHLSVSLLDDYVRSGDVEIAEEISNHGWSHLEGHTSQFHSTVDIIRGEDRSQGHVLKWQLVLAEALPVLIADVVQFNPAMTDILTLHVVQGALGFILRLEEAGALPCHLSILISSELD